MATDKNQISTENAFVTTFWSTFTGERKMSHIVPHFLNTFSNSTDIFKKIFAKKIIGEELIGKQINLNKLLAFVDSEILIYKAKLVKSNDKPTKSKSENDSIDNKYKIYDVDVLDGTEFEVFMKKLLDVNGYTDTQRIGKKGDQGGDILTHYNDEKIIIQAKNYSISRKVTNKAVQEVLGAIRYYNADKGIVVTNSFFTQSAMELANVNNITLWDRRVVTDLLKKYNDSM